MRLSVRIYSCSFLGLLGLFFSVPGAVGQKVPIPVRPAEIDPYRLEPFVIERKEVVYRFAADGTGSSQTTIVARIQAESAVKQVSVLTLQFAAQHEHVDWTYARVRHSDGTVTETPVTTAIEVTEPVTREAPFYSDLKDSQLPVRDLRVGDRLEWQATVVRTRAEAPGEYWGQIAFLHDGVVLAEKLELHLPRDKYVNVWSPSLKPVETADGTERVLVWSSECIKLTVGPQADAAREIEKKRVRSAEEELDAREGKLPDVAWTSFKSWEAVGAWYRGLEGERMLPDAEVKAKVAQLVAGKATQEAKVQAVYAYVATQVRYIGVAFGVGRFQPHSAGEVLGNQYGDCKDKHTLLAAMLASLGLKPDAVLIGAGIRFNQAVPSPAAFNHLITRVSVDGKPVWLDTTAEIAPYGMLVYVTRDHDALVVPEDGPAKIERTQALPPFKNTQHMEAVGVLDADGLSNSRITLTFRGDDELQIRAVMRQVSPGQYDQLAQNISNGMGYIGTASHFEAGRAEDTTIPFTMSFDYKRDKAGDWPNYRTIPQLSPVTLYRPDEKEPPVQAIELGIPRTETSHSSMTLPPGWKVELPEAIHARSEYATYDQTYQFQNGIMSATRKLEVLKERVPVSDWKAYDKFVKKADFADEDYIQLVRGPAPRGASPNRERGTEAVSVNPPPMPERTSIKALLENVGEALKNDHLDLAEILFARIKAAHPDAPGVWAAEAGIRFKRGDLPGTKTALEKELELYPANTSVYQLLVQVDLASHHEADAKKSLTQWAAGDPTNAKPVVELAALYLADDDAAAAVEVLQPAVSATSTEGKWDEQVALLLGRAQMKSGAKEQGHQTLLALLKDTNSPNTKNNAGYELADAGFELPLVEQTTRAALEEMEEQSRAWTLDENADTLHNKTTMLQATWDTMGWVYFRAGKLAQAEQYIGASWRGRQSPEVGGHLAEIALARGDRDGAVTLLDLAQANYDNHDAMGVQRAPGTAQKAIISRMDALKKAGAHRTTGDSHDALQKMRVFPLGAASGLKGVADYKLLVADGVVKRVLPVDQKELAGGDERLKQVDLRSLMPTGSHAQIVLTGMLNCHQAVCELILH